MTRARGPLFLALAATASIATAPAGAQEVAWERELRGDIRNVLRNHYLRDLSSDSRSIDCLAERGDNCFGGDHEDWFCRRVFDCRTPAVRFQFVMELIGAADDGPDDPGLGQDDMRACGPILREAFRLEDPDECPPVSGGELAHVLPEKAGRESGADRPWASDPRPARIRSP